MISKGKRVPRALFKTIGSDRKSLFSPLFTLSVSRYAAQKPTRFSVVVSKKVAKTAVSRNLLKRQAYSAIQAIKTPLKPGFLGVFYAKQPAPKAPFSQISLEIKGLLEKSGMI